MNIVAWAMAAAVLSRMLNSAAARLWARAAATETRSSDVTVTILTILAPSGRGDSSVVISIFNPGSRPVLAGLSVRPRRRPDWLGPGPRTRIVRRTAGRRYRADRQAMIGIVPAAGISLLPVDFAAIQGRHCVVAVLGQSDSRLRVISIPLGTRSEHDTWPTAIECRQEPR